MEKKKSKLSLYLENLWYHEKAKIIIIAVLVIFIGFSAVQCALNVTADIYILYAGAAQPDSSVSGAFDKAMEKYIPEDYNGDGHIKASFESYLFGADFIKEQKYFDAEVYGGKTVILLLSPSGYEYCKNNDYLVTLSDALGEKPDVAKNNYCIVFSELDCADKMGLGRLPDDTLLCIAAPKNKANAEEYNNQIEFLRYMLETK